MLAATSPDLINKITAIRPATAAATMRPAISTAMLRPATATYPFSRDAATSTAPGQIGTREVRTSAYVVGTDSAVKASASTANIDMNNNNDSNDDDSEDDATKIRDVRGAPSTHYKACDNNSDKNERAQTVGSVCLHDRYASTPLSHKATNGSSQAVSQDNVLSLETVQAGHPVNGKAGYPANGGGNDDKDVTRGVEITGPRTRYDEDDCEKGINGTRYLRMGGHEGYDEGRDDVYDSENDQNVRASPLPRPRSAMKQRPVTPA